MFCLQRKVYKNKIGYASHAALRRIYWYSSASGGWFDRCNRRPCIQLSSSQYTMQAASPPLPDEQQYCAAVEAECGRKALSHAPPRLAAAVACSRRQTLCFSCPRRTFVLFYIISRRPPSRCRSGPWIARSIGSLCYPNPRPVAIAIVSGFAHSVSKLAGSVPTALLANGSGHFERPSGNGSAVRLFIQATSHRLRISLHRCVSHDRIDLSQARCPRPNLAHRITAVSAETTALDSGELSIRRRPQPGQNRAG